MFGTGAAGLTAALVASAQGLNVLVCEKSAQIGGTTATSGGTIWAPGAPPIARAGGKATSEQARRYLTSELGPWLDQGLLDAFLESAPEAVAFLEKNSEVCFEHWSNPDYHADAPHGSATGHSMTALPFDGTKLGSDFARLRPPRDVFMVAGGMMVGRREIPILVRPFASFASMRRTVGLLFKHAMTRLRHARGTRLLIGNALIARFMYSLKQRGVPTLTNARLIELRREGQRVTGAVIEVDGQAVLVRARRGVVLATGGFPHNPELRQQLAPNFPHSHSMAFEGNTGDGILAGSKVGGIIETSLPNPAFWSPGSMRRHADGSQTLWVHGHMDRGKPGFLAVDASGRRFANEAESYHDVVVAMYKSRQGVQGIPAYFICDHKFLRQFGMGLVRPVISRIAPFLKDKYLVKGNSIEELAGKINVDATQLKATIDAYNQSAISGVDAEFGRGSTTINRFNGDPACRPNPCIRPLTGPYYAVEAFPCTIGTTIGLKTDPNACVLDASDARIEGLYACGNDMASVMRGFYPGPGVTLGPGVTFAYRAARQMARDADAGPASTLR